MGLPRWARHPDLLLSVAVSYVARGDRVGAVDAVYDCIEYMVPVLYWRAAKVYMENFAGDEILWCSHKGGWSSALRNMKGL